MSFKDDERFMFLDTLLLSSDFYEHHSGEKDEPKTLNSIIRFHVCELDYLHMSEGHTIQNLIVIEQFNNLHVPIARYL